MAKQSGLKGFEKVMAIKRILPHLTQDAEFVSMFINEAKLAALLSHQNIVQIFDLGHIEGFYFIAMEYVMGKDLRSISQRAKALNQPLSVGHALMIMSKVCAGLDYAHRKKDLSGRSLNLVHRDISPQNILVSYEGEVKVVDFGIAKAATQSSETRTGILKGKLSYMAPEQAWGKGVDCRADIFAIGIVLYELLTGQKLFKGDNDFNTLERVREARVDPLPGSLNNQVSPELEAIVLKALAKEPEDRYSTAAELQTAIEDFMSQKGYDQSTARMAQVLRKLFEYDIEQDTDRLTKATGANPAGFSSNIADQSTLVRPLRPPSELTPSHPSRRIHMEDPKRRSGAPVIRTVFLTVILMFSGAVLLSVNNPPFLQKAVEARPEIELITGMLARWPEQAVDTVQAMISGNPSAEEQARPSVFDPSAESADSSAHSTDMAQAMPVSPVPDASS
ncbi:MAG TPA: serine/threonine-protein kinase, partial [Nitrospiria bacterium]